MDISLPVSLIIIALIVIAWQLWQDYRKRKPEQAAQIEKIYERGVRITQDLKETGFFGELEDKGRKALEWAQIYVIEEAHRRGYEIDREQVENDVRAMYQKIYGGK